MFETLSAAPRRDPHLRSIAPALTSLLVHSILLGAALSVSWLRLPPLPLPILRPEIFQPVFLLPRAGAPAPRLGSPEGASARDPVRPSKPPEVSPQAVPPEIAQPRESQENPEATQPPSPAVDPSADAVDSGALGPGDPSGVIGGDPHGKRGASCVGDCDPDGPVGLGPGDRDGVDDSDQIFTPGLAGVTEPVIIVSSRVLPVYPELARRARVEGVVILQAVIQADGRVDSVTLLRESPPGLGFGKAALEAVQRWRYRPGTQQGRPVAVYFTIHVEFSLTR